MHEITLSYMHDACICNMTHSYVDTCDMTTVTNGILRPATHTATHTATHCNTLQHTATRRSCRHTLGCGFLFCLPQQKPPPHAQCWLHPFFKFNAARGAVGGEPHIRLTRSTLRCRDAVCRHSKSPPPHHFLRDSHRKDAYRTPHQTPAANLLCFESVKVN